MAVTEERAAGTSLEEARRAGVKRVRIHFTDLIGISRNKVVPVSLLEELCEEGVNFCIGAYAVAHSGEVIEETGLGGEVEFRDMKVYPDLSTLRVVPWESETAVCMANVEFDGESLAVDPRGILKRAIGELGERGLTAACGHELEFFLLRPGPSGYEQYSAVPGLVYTHTPAVDTQGVIREMEDAVTALGLPYVCSNQEYFGSQWEINLKYAEALQAADDAHLLKLAIKEIAAKHGLLATFMGKPLDGEGTSGYHLHLSLWENGENVFYDPDAPDGLSELCRQFVAGQLEHARATTAVMAPTINAYKRFVAFAMAPYTVTWGPDNRTVYIRIPAERGKATRVENRAGDGTANAYLAAAAAIFSGLDGIDRKLDPGEPTRGDAYSAEGVPLVPLSLAEALDALEADEYLRQALGPRFVRAFVALKRDEHKRFTSSVTEWELREYLNVL
ncbi:MAG TPA: glutamine synthetase family protein [Gaiellaceae bacterium]|jgi:glutamine synthetase|nr:glutamine synthetase family protein [Gaiellaceae bacterium]